MSRPAWWYDQSGYGCKGIFDVCEVPRGTQLKTAGTPALNLGVAINSLSSVTSSPVTIVFSGLQHKNNINLLRQWK